jgi:hypothetical protein
MKLPTLVRARTRVMSAVARRLDRGVVGSGNPVGMLDIEHITRVPTSIRSVLPR